MLHFTTLFGQRAIAVPTGYEVALVAGGSLFVWTHGDSILAPIEHRFAAKLE